MYSLSHATLTSTASMSSIIYQWSKMLFSINKWTISENFMMWNLYIFLPLQGLVENSPNVGMEF